jgi:superfamily II DNA or RNA helicase
MSAQFPSWLRDRGADYFRSGAVRLDQVSPQAIRATVAGSESYTVDLRNSNSGVAVECTCPYYRNGGGGCKHIWAVILAADKDGRFVPSNGRGAVDDRQEDGADDDLDFDEDDLDLDENEDQDEEDDDIPIPRSWDRAAGWRGPRPVPPAPPPEKPWQKALSYVTDVLQARPESPWPAEREIVYVIDVAGTRDQKGLAVSVSWRQRTVKGPWTQIKPVRLKAALVPTMPDATDRSIFSVLLGARGEYDGFGYDPYSADAFLLWLRPPLDRVAVPMMLGCGRGLIRTEGRFEPTPLAWDGGAPWALAIDITEDGSDYVVAGSLRREGQSRPLAEALLLTASGLVFFPEAAAAFDHEGGFAWVLALRGEGGLRVPKTEGDALRRALTRSKHPLRVESPAGLALSPLAIPPRPRLQVSRQRSDRLRCDLSFDYGGQLVPAGDPGWAVVRAEEPLLIARDAAAESAAAGRLRTLGARSNPGTRDRPPQLELTPSHLARLSTALLAEGWLLEMDGGLYRAPSGLRLRVSSGIDWFDLEGAADFGDRSVPLPDLAAAIHRGEASVDLGDGTIGVIPADWKRRLALLSSGTSAGKDAVRFTRGQAVLLDALLEAQPQVDVDARFEDVRRRLRGFAGVHPEAAPAGFEGDLRAYQQEGLGWMRFLREFGFGGILADDMGLGKTVQLLALLESRRAEGVGRPSLVVVPKSLVFNWMTEAARFAPALRLLQHTGAARGRHSAALSATDVVLTTYGTLRRDVLLLKDVAFDYVVLDEAQAVKNPKTAAAKAARLLSAAHRLALSGTPIENHVGELASILEFANPGLLGRTRAFERGSGELGDEGCALLARTIRPFVLRRTKDQVAADLPPRTEQILHCALDPPQRAFYDALRDRYRQSLLRRVERDGMARSKIHVLEALLRLRQAACHPGLVDRAKAGDPSAKIDSLLLRLEELRTEGHKSLVFSQFTSLLDLVGPRLDAHGIRHTRLDGRTRDRAARVREFQEDTACGVFLVSLKAGGQGLNLTAASYVFVLDPWWNPAVEVQAIDRTHRIGQTRPVFAYRLIAEDTVEEKVLELQARKRDLAKALITEDHGLIARLGREDLELLLS